MKKTNIRQNSPYGWPLTKVAMGIGLFTGLATLPLQVQADENIPAGYEEEEWYDPTDWFDGNDIQPAETEWSDNAGWNNSYGTDNTTNRDRNRDWTSDNDLATTSAATNNTSYYNWDPVVVGWASSDERGQSGQKSDRQQARQQSDQRATSLTGQAGQRADKQSDQRTSNQARQKAANRENRNSGQTNSFEGTVEGFKEIDLKDREGKTDKYTFVRVSLENEDKRVVSLGSKVNLSDLKLEQGDEINVSGRNTRIDNRDVLVANRIEVGDKTFRIAEKNRIESGDQVSMQGTVKDFNRTSLSNHSRDKNLLVRLELKNGKSCVVDLGRGTTLSDLDIEKGSEISVQGDKTKVNGKSLIVANRISVNGDRTRVRGGSQNKENASSDRDEADEYSSIQSTSTSTTSEE